MAENKSRGSDINANNVKLMICRSSNWNSSNNSSSSKFNIHNHNYYSIQ